MERFYRIPVQIRFTAVGGPFLIFPRVTAMEVDGIGLLVEHEKRKVPDAKTVRRHLIGRKSDTVLIEAPSLAAALRELPRAYPGAAVGTTSKAIEIDRDRPIHELPACELMHRSKEGRLICGKEVGKDGNGEYGMCVLSGYDPPGFFCPVSEYNSVVADDPYKNPKHRLPRTRCYGHKVIRSKPVMKRVNHPEAKAHAR